MVGQHTGPTITRGPGVYGATGTALRTRNRGTFAPGTQMIFPVRTPCRALCRSSNAQSRQISRHRRFHGRICHIIGGTAGPSQKKCLLNNTQLLELRFQASSFLFGPSMFSTEECLTCKSHLQPGYILLLRFTGGQLSGPRRPHVKRVG